MAYEMKDGEFNLFKNDKKTEQNHPDYTGKVMVNGTVLRMAAWIKQKDGGLAYFSGKVSEFQQREQQSAPVEDPLNPSTPGPIEQAMNEPITPGRSAKKIVQERNAAAEQPPVDDGLPF